MLKSILRFGFITALLTTGILPAMAADITLSGSTTVQKRVLEPAAEAIQTATGVKVRVRGTSSGKGFKEILDGKAMASIASSPLASLLSKYNVEDDGTYQEHVITRDVIVPIVHPANPVSELTFQQLSDINTGKITNWIDVGGPDMKIVVITSSKGSATRSVFQKFVMMKQPYIKGVREVKSTRKEVALVSKFKGGIGAVSQGFVDANPGKVNMVKTGKISRPLCVITKGDPDNELGKVIAYLKTDQAKKYFK
ncbi:MAG: substrate-binding domain-containing protein [Chromatiales bacterium]